ncbi:crossover junction endodeoxyribonuclease RuvC [Hyphomicrobiales bacterium FT118]|uniref:Crossover junction endodeoxyribonuclease RuvC n=1 Tax=Futiania mangrovi TaxID=2959716 RepID=A0A9J6PE40_9PROT|nr:crossover junction endodeoxyribonuclease RuvC [Futiania mangrovii]
MAAQAIRILGLDPGLRRTGWGVVEIMGSRLRHVANGVVGSDGTDDLARRLLALHDGLGEVIAGFSPDEAAVEKTFVNKDPVATLKLGQARAISLLVPARAGLRVAEYAPNLVKKSVVGVGLAGKEQVQHMVRLLLPGVTLEGPDSADALAVAICHAHHRGQRTLAEAVR